MGGRAVELGPLLRAIVARPDDDGPRLAYADWLAGNGDPDQAQFIRVQCASAAAPADDPRQAHWQQQARTLSEAHGATWAAALVPGAREVEFARGLPYAAAVAIAPPGAGGDGWLDRLAVLDRAPIQRLRPMVTGDPVRWDHAEPDTDLYDLVDDVEAGLSAELAGRLADDPRLSRVRELYLDDFEWGGAPLRALLAGSHWDGLRTLVIGDEDCKAYAARAIADCPSLRRLTTLVFAGDYYGNLGDDGAATIADAPALATLHNLNLLNVGLGPSGAQALARSPHLGALTSLDLGWGSYSTNWIGPDGAAALAASPTLAELTHLVLDFNSVADDGLRALAASTTLGQLRSLSLKASGIGDEGLSALAMSHGLPRLDTLELSFNKEITAAGIAALAAVPRFADLHTLWLRRVEPAAITAIAGSPYATGLRDLNLHGSPIGDAEALAIVGSPNLAGLTRLRLTGDTLTGTGRSALRGRFGDQVGL